MDSDFKFIPFGLIIFFVFLIAFIIIGWGFILSLLAAGISAFGLFFSLNVFLDTSSKGIKFSENRHGSDVFYGVMGIIFAGIVIFAAVLSGMGYPKSTSTSSSSSSGYSYCASVAEDDLRSCMSRAGSDERKWRACERDYNYMMAGCTATE